MYCQTSNSGLSGWPPSAIWKHKCVNWTLLGRDVTVELSAVSFEIAMTRLLLSVDILRRKTEKSILSTAGARKTEDALAASRRAEASLRDKLNRENVQTTRLRRAAVEQLTHLHKWKE